MEGRSEVSSCDKKTWHEDTVLGKMAGGGRCKPITQTNHDKVVRCHGKRLTEAYLSRDRAISVLTSYKQHFGRLNIEIDHGTVGERELEQWKQFYSTPGKKLRCRDTRYAFLTPKRVQDLIDVMGKIEFMEDNSKENEEVFAYVFPQRAPGEKPDYKVYLCQKFWEASEELTEDSRIGTLIHEVSHFLGTEDITYANKVEMDTIELINKDHGATAGKESTMDLVVHLGKLERGNANNVEYEIEIDLRHLGRYVNREWTCCGDREQFSVCHRRMHTVSPLPLSDVSTPTGGEVLIMPSLHLSVDVGLTQEENMPNVSKLTAIAKRQEDRSSSSFGNSNRSAVIFEAVLAEQKDKKDGRLKNRYKCLSQI